MEKRQLYCLHISVVFYALNHQHVDSLVQDCSNSSAYTGVTTVLH